MHDFRKSLIKGALRKVLKRVPFPLEVMRDLGALVYGLPLSLRHIEDMIAKRAVFSLTSPRYIAGRSGS